MTASTRRFLIRERTSAHHAAVDTAVGSFDTLERYRIYLQGLWVFRRPFEDQLDQIVWPEHFGDWRPRTIGPLILRDMDDLNVTGVCPRCDISLGGDLESVMGALYVLQGSSLGARILLSRARALGLSESHGARHLAGLAHSDDWKTYLQLLDSAPQMDMDKVIDASRAAFAVAERAFKDNMYA
jgi:heme oxygenase (biliverdin-IX-beta and delta-forming)